MKKVILLSSLLFSACTISDTYWKPDVGPNNVGTKGIEQTNSLVDGGFLSEEVEISDHCSYLLYVFKVSNDCSPDRIAYKNNIKTITEVNTQQIWLPFLLIQKNTIIGIPEKK